MEALLQERLTILKEAGMMDEQTEVTVYHLVERLKEDGVEISDENIGMFLTHFIAALHRSKSDEAITKTDTELMAELKKNPHYTKAHSYFAELEKVSGVRLEEAEEAYVGGYLCILLAKGKEEKE